jgi:hypothetical protein
MQDPDTTFDQLKALRLVCRSFDQLCSPRVLACIRLFGYDSNAVLANSRHLKSVTSSKQHNLPIYTLVIPNWRWIHFHEGRLWVSFRRMREERMVLGGILWNTLFVPIFHLLRCLVEPTAVLADIFNVFVRLEVKLRLNYTKEIGFSSIRRVE